MDQVKLEEVILCSKERRGKGTEADPIRIIHQVYTKDGNLIAENDPEVLYTKLDMCKFAEFFNGWRETTATIEVFKVWMDSVKFNHR